MSKRYRCKPKAVKVFRSNKGNSDYDKLAEAIVRAQKKEMNKKKLRKSGNIVNFVFAMFFFVIGIVLFFCGIYRMETNAKQGAYIIMLSIIIASTGFFTHMAPKVKKNSVIISLVVAVMAVVSIVVNLLIAMYF